MSKDLKILQAFETALAAVADDLEVAYMNTRLPSETDAHLEAHLLFGDTTAPSIGNEHVRKQGIFQVTVVGNAGDGMARVYGVVETLENAFYRGREMFKDEGVLVLVDEPPETGNLFNDGPNIRVPVSISFAADFIAA